jgi:hypothetical protein
MTAVELSTGPRLEARGISARVVLAPISKKAFRPSIFEVPSLAIGSHG